MLEHGARGTMAADPPAPAPASTRIHEAFVPGNPPRWSPRPRRGGQAHGQAVTHKPTHWIFLFPFTTQKYILWES